MIVVLKNGISSQAVGEITQELEELGYAITPIVGVEKTILAAVGGAEHAKIDALERIRAHETVEDVLLITRPYKLVAREYKPERSVVQIGNVAIGGNEVVMMAGPCTVESEEQLWASAEAVSRAGAKVLRGGAYKPSTSPYSYQGMGVPGLKLLRQAADTFGMKVVTEVMDPRKVDLVAEYADILQVGTRNMQNFDLLKEVGKCDRAVMLKRGMSAKIEEWLLAAEYVASSGNENILLCERGIRTFEPATRNTLDLSAVPVLKAHSHLPVIVDPSHGTGVARYVASMAKAALVAGADGVMVEMHPNPKAALSDGSQALTPPQFDELMAELRRLAPFTGVKM